MNRLVQGTPRHSNETTIVLEATPATTLCDVCADTISRANNLLTNGVPSE